MIKKLLVTKTTDAASRMMIQNKNMREEIKKFFGFDAGGKQRLSRYVIAPHSSQKIWFLVFGVVEGPQVKSPEVHRTH